MEGQPRTFIQVLNVVCVCVCGCVVFWASPKTYKEHCRISPAPYLVVLVQALACMHTYVRACTYPCAQMYARAYKLLTAFPILLSRRLWINRNRWSTMAIQLLFSHPKCDLLSVLRPERQPCNASDCKLSNDCSARARIKGQRSSLHTNIGAKCINPTSMLHKIESKRFMYCKKWWRIHNVDPKGSNHSLCTCSTMEVTTSSENVGAQFDLFHRAPT